jgi:histidyl-tRNA synthetase
MKYPIAKGTFDILPKDPSKDGSFRQSHLWHFVEETIHTLARQYGFAEIRTPIFERTELFCRSVGESSDIVTKEMYTFEDKAGRMMTLRPEGTAAVMRSFVEKRLDQLGGKQKLYYIGPMFRYERPQAGRYRQHHQFGVEVIGDPSPEQDVEVIDLLVELYRRLGLQNLTVLLNSVGDAQSRENYRAALRSFLEPKLPSLSPESQTRFETNVLRILDSKDPNDQQALEGAPLLDSFLSDEAKDHFQKVKALLDAIQIPYIVTPKLVRGLDYYNQTVFEVTTTSLGAQNAIGAGGRYDGLTALLGGPSLPAVGFATGIERILQTMLDQNVPLPEKPHPLIYLIPIGDEAKKASFALVHNLRKNGICAEIDFNPKKVGKALEHAVSCGSTYALVFGEEELASKQINLKHLATREEELLPLEEVVDFLLGKQSKKG